MRILEGTGTRLDGLVDWLETVETLAKRGNDGVEAINKLLTSAASEQLAVYVAEPFGKMAFRIVARAWADPSSGLDGMRSLQSGRLTIDQGAFPANSIERRLADHPLLCRAITLPVWAAERRPAAAALKRAAQSLIAEFRQADSAKRLAKRDFAAELARRTGASKRQAETYYELAPEDWRKRGPKGPRGNRR